MKKCKYFLFLLFIALLCCISAVSAVSDSAMDNNVSEIHSNLESISVNDEKLKGNVEYESALSNREEHDNLSANSNEQIIFPTSDDDYFESADDYNNESILFQDIDVVLSGEDNWQNQDILGASNTVKTKITAKSITKYYQDGTCVYAYLKNSNGKALSGKKITITYSGKTYSRTTDSKGCVKWDVQKTPGTYAIKFSFSASGYQSCSESVKVIVKPIPTSITANNLVLTYGNGNNKLNAYLKDNKGKALANKVVVFNFAGTEYEKTTNSNGVATLNIGALPNTYSTIISFSAANYVTSTKKVTVKVNPIPTSLTVDNLICTYNGTNKISAFLKSNNNPLANENVNLNINGHNYAGKTDSKGQVSFSFNEEPKSYLATVSFSKNGYASCSKQVSILINSIPTELSVDDLICEYGKDNYLHAYLKTNGKPLANQEISFSINDNIYKSKTDHNGKVSYKINYQPGEYRCNVSYSDKYYKSASKIVKLSIKPKIVNFEYSISIPNYVNLTNYWRVVNGYLTSEYIATPGANGKVKMPVKREYIIITENNQYTYSSQDLKSKNLLIKINEYSNLQINSNSESTTFTYTGYISEDVNQISAIYRQKEVMGMSYPDFEELLITINSAFKLSIGFSNPIGWDETGVRMAFVENNYKHINDGMWCRYDAFNHYGNLRFAETGELVEYRSDMLKISNFPSKEKITTQFKMNGTSIIKDEWVSFGKHYDKENSFEVIQSYAVTNRPITKQTLDFVLDMNQGYPTGFRKASYGTFLTAFNTIRLYDEFMGKLSDLYNVTAIRDGFAVSMCGVEFGGTAYVHSPDPTMKYKLNGEEENVYICKYFSSFFLSEFECMALRMAGVNCTSSIYTIFSKMLNFENYSLVLDENKLHVSLINNSVNEIIFDLGEGTLFDLSYLDNFSCKGAISNNLENYCFHDRLTNNILMNYRHSNNNLPISQEYLDLCQELASEIALIGSAAAFSTLILLIAAGVVIAPLIALPLAVGLVLLGVGVALKYNVNHDWGKSFGDSITSLALNMA